jgi:hypothetical protein
MSDTTFKHLIAFVATFITLLAYVSGYVSGQQGWWWTGFGLLVIYGGIYKLVK